MRTSKEQRQINTSRNETIRRNVRIFKNQGLPIAHVLLSPSLPLNKTQQLVEISGIFNVLQHPGLAKDRGAVTSVSNLIEKVVYLNQRNTSSAGTQ